MLGHEGFSIDYRARQILFGASDAADWVAGFDPRLPQVVVELQIDAHPVRLLVDTGAKYFILFARKNSEPLPHDAGASRAHDGANAGGNAGTGTGATKTAED